MHGAARCGTCSSATTVADGDPLILVAHGATRTLNPILSQRVVDRALEKDRARATAEYLAEFRTDVEGFVALEVVESCVGDYREQMPASGRALFRPLPTRPAAARTHYVGHRAQGTRNKRIIIDAVREATAAVLARGRGR